MKRIFSLITVFLMLSALTGCNKAETPDTVSETTVTVAEETIAPETVATTEETTVETTTPEETTVAEETTTPETTTTATETTTVETTTTVPETTTTVPETTTVATTTTIATTTTVVTTTAPQRATPAEYVKAADEIAALVNSYRRSKGLQECQVSVYLTNAAQIRAVESVTSFTHDRPDGRKYNTALEDVGIKKSLRDFGEIMANWSPGNTNNPLDPDYIVNGIWLKSSGHKAIIDMPQWNYMGVGIVKSSSGRYYFIIEFAETKRGLTYIP